MSNIRQRVGISLIGAAVAGVFGGAAVIAFQPIHHEQAPASVNLHNAGEVSTPAATVTVTSKPAAAPVRTVAPAPVKAPAPVVSKKTTTTYVAPKVATVSTPAADPTPVDTTTTAPPKVVAPPNKPGEGPYVPPVVESEPAPSAS